MASNEDVVMQPVPHKLEKKKAKKSPLEDLTELRKQLDAMAEMMDEIACEAQKEETIERCKTPPPEIVLETIEYHDGTPVIVRKMLSEMGERRKKIEEMWKKEGRTQTYIPGSERARQAKMKAKVENRIETRHAEIVREIIEKKQVPLTQTEAVVAQAVPID